MSTPIKSTPWKLAVTVTSVLAALGLAGYALYLRSDLNQVRERTSAGIASRQNDLAQLMQSVDSKKVEELVKQLTALNERRTGKNVPAEVIAALDGEWTVESVESKPKKSSERGEILLTLRRERMPVAAWPELLTTLERIAAAWPGCGISSALLKTNHLSLDRNFEGLEIVLGQDFINTSKKP